MTKDDDSGEMGNKEMSPVTFLRGSPDHSAEGRNQVDTGDAVS